MTVSQSSKLTLKYLNLPKAIGGRGGVERFFLLSQNIPFEDNLVSFADWGMEKERLMKSGENPCGNVPLLYYQQESGQANDSLPLSQHIATCRYLAKVHGVVSSEASHEEYIQDLVADEYQGFRNAWAGAAFGGDVDKYSKELPGHLSKFETLYKQLRTHKAFLSVSPSTGQPLWGDAALFGLLRDHIRIGLLTEEELGKYPALSALFQAYMDIPAVSEWCRKKENDATE